MRLDGGRRRREGGRGGLGGGGLCLGGGCGERGLDGQQQGDAGERGATGERHQGRLQIRAEPAKGRTLARAGRIVEVWEPERFVIFLEKQHRKNALSQAGAAFTVFGQP
jgi:hypothetical protein